MDLSPLADRCSHFLMGSLQRGTSSNRSSSPTSQRFLRSRYFRACELPIHMSSFSRPWQHRISSRSTKPSCSSRFPLTSPAQATSPAPTAKTAYCMPSRAITSLCLSSVTCGRALAGRGRGGSRGVLTSLKTYLLARWSVARQSWLERTRMMRQVFAKSGSELFIIITTISGRPCHKRRTSHWTRAKSNNKTIFITFGESLLHFKIAVSHQSLCVFALLTEIALFAMPLLFSRVFGGLAEGFIIYCHSSYSTMNSKLVVRQSGVVEQPQQFVTVEIHNSTVRKKFRNHRESIINEMKHTEDLLEETLNRNLRHPRSKFSPTLAPTATTTPRRQLRTHLPTPRPSHGAGGQLSRKLKQLCNISQHFDQACEYRHRVLPTLQAADDAPYALPVAAPPPPPSPSHRKAKEELAEHRTMVREWESKVRLGRDFVKRAKLKHPLRAGELKQERGQDRRESSKPSLRSLRDLYYTDLRPERKTAPLPGNNSLQLLFLDKREKQTARYAGSVEEEPALLIKRFIEGGDGGEGEYSDWLSLSEFRRSRENYQTLDRLYNHVKESNLYEFKDMNADKFTHQSLLSIVYYLENANNLTEGERRALRKKLRVVE